MPNSITSARSLRHVSSMFTYRLQGEAVAVIGGHYAAGLKGVHTLTPWLRAGPRGPQAFTLWPPPQKVQLLRHRPVSPWAWLWWVGVALAAVGVILFSATAWLWLLVVLWGWGAGPPARGSPRRPVIWR